ncbi:DUF1152 domain-containing protein [Kutzneria sp. 744]|uniref:DUF1152 domain-containing protein n=1 Tax=Kutzneria sp. (strain 744) TaxID=345341 RepID=UPI0005BB2F1C|nr:DUF1152 domain-containing protein [Kutzneria sp. 744]
MSSLTVPPLFARLSDAQRILIAGAGGGFDVYAGLPLATALRASGKQVHLANLSFSDLDGLDIDSWVEPGLAAVTPDSLGGAGYFPERTLSRWLSARSLPSTVYAFPRTGVQPLRSAYATLVRRLDLDAIVLVDGGTDILMQGDESGIGTPEEDMASLAAVAGLDGIDRLVVSLGFGIDSFHGVSHADVLENLAMLQRVGGYLGALSIPPDSPEAAAYLDAVSHAQSSTPLRPSIVNGQIAAAVRGQFGNVHVTSRTSGSELFVNPLMAVYFTVDLLTLARHVKYLPSLENTRTITEIAYAIEDYRDTVPRRPRRTLPH